MRCSPLPSALRLSTRRSMRNKYHNKGVLTLDGHFDSRKEYDRFVELSLAQRAGVIRDLRRQVRYNLVPSQKREGKVVERAVDYIADFVYVKDGKEIVEDCKGYRTPEYIIKRKLMLYLKGIRIYET